jgi:hypothetical protein
MQRRTKLILLIVAAAILLAIGIYILIQPFLPGTPAQPPGLPTGATPSVTIPSTGVTASATPATPAIAPDVKRMEDFASMFVSRMGSGSSADGFTGYDDVLLNATPAYRQTLRAEQAALQTAHPVTGPSFGVSTRVVSTDSSGASSGAQEAVIAVEVQRAEDAGNPSSPTSITYKQADVTLQKQGDGTYLVSSVVWKDIQR